MCSGKESEICSGTIAVTSSTCEQKSPRNSLYKWGKERNKVQKEVVPDPFSRVELQPLSPANSACPGTNVCTSFKHKAVTQLFGQSTGRWLSQAHPVNLLLPQQPSRLCSFNANSQIIVGFE